jgi:hypothetical protein
VLIRPGVGGGGGGLGADLPVGGTYEDLLNAVGMMAALSLTACADPNPDQTLSGLGLSRDDHGIGLLTHHLFIVFPLAC